jgi:hypothetical protein
MFKTLIYTSLLFSSLTAMIHLETYPTNGQIGEIKFFIPKPKLCKFNISEFNIRFKKCSIPLSYGQAIPQILNGLNKNDLGMRKLYETFCVKKEKKELSLFENGEIKADVGDLTEKYPFTSFQRVICHTKNAHDEETIELEKEISMELGETLHNNMEMDFGDDGKTVEVRFTLQPTIEQKEKEKRSNDESFLTIGVLDDDEQLEGNKDHWIDDVVGGYFLEDELDYSHIQDSSFVFQENSSMTHKLSSIEARPILWMVLFEWKNANHLDKVSETNLHDLQMSIEHNNAEFLTNKGSIVNFLDNQMSNMERHNMKRRIDLRIGKLRLKVSHYHASLQNERRLKYPPVHKFIHQLEDEIEQDN